MADRRTGELVAEPLTRAHHRGAAVVYADAFVDDPGWLSVAPRGRRARWKYIERTCLAAMRVADRWCGPSWCVVEDGEPVGVLVGCDPGLWSPPRLQAAARAAPAALLAGPPTLVRSLGAQRVFDEHHPAYDHFLVWLFAVTPSHQRRGVGRRLMGEALAQADAHEVPAYLWTGNPDNLPYYHSHGFRVFAEAPIPGGAPNWFMERPAAA